MFVCACPACPVASADGTGVDPVDRAGVGQADRTGVIFFEDNSLPSGIPLSGFAVGYIPPGHSVFNWGPVPQISVPVKL